jgi:REP element-mobilizing transposase RayT
MKSKPRKPKQYDLLPKQDSFYGGSLRKTRKGRRGARPLAIKKSMHVVLRSSKAIGGRSFHSHRNKEKVTEILKSHASRNHVRILSFANVGNHLHLHIQLGVRAGYFSFIRAVTAAIAMHVMGWSRWTRQDPSKTQKPRREKFWDYRPYTNVVTSWSGFLKLRDYVKINQFEAGGLPRDLAILIVKNLNPLSTNTT